jgi:hypothetical protein
MSRAITPSRNRSRGRFGVSGGGDGTGEEPSAPAAPAPAPPPPPAAGPGSSFFSSGAAIRGTASPAPPVRPSAAAAAAAAAVAATPQTASTVPPRRFAVSPPPALSFAGRSQPAAAPPSPSQGLGPERRSPLRGGVDASSRGGISGQREVGPLFRDVQVSAPTHRSTTSLLPPLFLPSSLLFPPFPPRPPSLFSLPHRLCDIYTYLDITTHYQHSRGL